MNTNKDQREDADAEASEAAEAETTEQGAESAGGDALDLEGLDLTVETVEERISPSETNVFDK